MEWGEAKRIGRREGGQDGRNTVELL